MTRVIAYDLGSPQLNSTEFTVVMNVIRNLYAPEFINSPYTIRVRRDSEINGNIGQVFVRDRDTTAPYNQWTLTTTGDGGATSYFSIRPNGAIYVRSSLIGAPASTYLYVHVYQYIPIPEWQVSVFYYLINGNGMVFYYPRLTKSCALADICQKI